MTRTARDALVGLLYIVVIAALVALSIMVYNHDFTSYTNVALRTDNIGSSLQKGSDVKVRGVLVGAVDDITTNGDGATVHLQLDPSKVKALPANMQAQLLPKTLFGERYVSLEFPTAPSGSHLRSGDTIHQDMSQHSVELEKLFSDLLPVLQAVKPEKLAATLGELAAALRGRGNDLAATLTTVGAYLDRLAPNVPELTDDFKNLASVARVYTDAAPNLVSALNSFTTTSQTIVARRVDFTNLLSSATTFADTTGAFVGTNEQQIIGLSRNSVPSLRTLAQYSSEFPCIAQALTNYIPTADTAFGVGTNEPGAHVILHVVPASTPYTAADRPSFSSDAGPRCPYAPSTALAGTALGNLPIEAPAGSPATTRSSVSSAPAASSGIGTANSPQENQLIAELVAPTVGMAPSDYPTWASLVIGPALRGTEVTVK